MFPSQQVWSRHSLGLSTPWAGEALLLVVGGVELGEEGEQDPPHALQVGQSDYRAGIFHPGLGQSPSL